MDLKRIWKFVCALALCCIILGTAGVMVQADGTLDFSKDGHSSIEVIVETTAPTPVKGASLSLYQIKKLEADKGFVWNAEYNDCSVPLDGLNASQLAQSAKDLESYIKANHISGTQQTTDENGRTVFENLGLGLYLVVWDGNPQKVEAVSPVLLSVPIEEGSGFRYDITIRPKVELKEESSEAKESSEEESSAVPESSREPESKPRPSEPHSSEERQPDPEEPERPVVKPSAVEKASEEESEEIPSIELPSQELTNIDDMTAKGKHKFPQTGVERWRIFLLAGVGIVVFVIGVLIGDRKEGKRLWLSGVLMGAGIICLLFAVYEIYSAYREEQETTMITDEILEGYQECYLRKAQEMSFEEEPSYIVIDGEQYGGVLLIPSLGLTLPVDMELSYQQLKKTPCRYKGDVRDGTMVIAAHNYARHFGNINRLRAGDEVSYVDSDGQEYHYEVSENEILGAYDVEKMEEGDWDLTLLTCTYGGGSRITVRCKKINS